MEFLRNIFKAKASSNLDSPEGDDFIEIIDFEDYLTSQSSGTIDEIINTYNSNTVETRPEFIDYASIKPEDFDPDERRDILELHSNDTKLGVVKDNNVIDDPLLIEIDVNNPVTDLQKLHVNEDTIPNLYNLDKPDTEFETASDVLSEFDEILDNLQKHDRETINKTLTPKNTNDMEDLDEILLNLQYDKLKENDAVSIISISSDDHQDDLDESDSDTGYHSSDFEFISEDEAKKCGLFTPFKIPNPINNKGTMYTISVERALDVAEFEDYSYRDSHVIPEGDDYLNLFQGIHAPQFASAIFMDNKSVTATRSMHVDVGGIGFDGRMNRKTVDNASEHCKKEADENVKKILSMYPTENRKRRRRF